MNNIGIFTSSRADFGILKNIAIKLEHSKKYQLKIFIAGSHLSKFFGKTVNEIKREKFSKLVLCNNIILSNNQVNISKSLNKLGEIFTKKLSRNKIDTLILLGDRYELLPVSIISFAKKINIIHIHGGETTLGAIDNQVRHCVSMLSSYNFVATKKSKKKLINFGIEKKKIFSLGAPGLEAIDKDLKSKKFLEKKYNFKFGKINAMVSLHPETLSKKSVQYLNIFLNCTKKFHNINFIFTSPGADTDGYVMKLKIISHVKQNKNCYFFESLGHNEYLSFIKFSNFFIGNSSSGLIEVPSLKKISINLGNRQLGREKADSVINIPFNSKKIENTINKLMNQEYKNLKFNNPYYLCKKPSEEFIKKIKRCL